MPTHLGSCHLRPFQLVAPLPLGGRLRPRGRSLSQGLLQLGRQVGRLAHRLLLLLGHGHAHRVQLQQQQQEQEQVLKGCQREPTGSLLAAAWPRARTGGTADSTFASCPLAGD